MSDNSRRFPLYLLETMIFPSRSLVFSFRIPILPFLNGSFPSFYPLTDELTRTYDSFPFKHVFPTFFLHFPGFSQVFPIFLREKNGRTKRASSVPRHWRPCPQTGGAAGPSGWGGLLSLLLLFLVYGFV